MDGNTANLSLVFDHAVNGTLRIDGKRYQHMLDSADLTAAQKQEVLEALWSIIVTVVELGYGVHPLQELCGQEEKLSDEWSASNADALECKDTKNSDARKNEPEAK